MSSNQIYSSTFRIILRQVSLRFFKICNNLLERSGRVATVCHPRYSIDPNFMNQLVDLTISGQYVLIYGEKTDPRGSYDEDGYRFNDWPWNRQPIELWELNCTQSVRIPLPDHKLYLAEDEQNSRCNWLLDPSSTPKYLVGIVKSSFAGLLISLIVLVFDRINDPQFLHRLVLRFEGDVPYVITSSRLLVTKGVEHTSLVIGIETCRRPYHNRVYISDLENNFQEITPLNGPECWHRMWIRNNCIYCINQSTTNLHTTNVYYDGEHFVFNQLKQPVVRNIFENTDFTGDETLPSCFAHHMGGPELIGVADTRFLWKIYFGPECIDQSCPITKMSDNIYGYFEILVEQDFLICSGDRQGLTWTGAKPKVAIPSKYWGPLKPLFAVLSDSESDPESVSGSSTDWNLD